MSKLLLKLRIIEENLTKAVDNAKVSNIPLEELIQILTMIYKEEE